MDRKKLTRPIRNSGLRSRPWRKASLMIILFLCLGCTHWQKQLSTYTSGQEQTFAYPLRQVILISGKGLKDLGFTIIRLEFLERRGFIQGLSPEAKATLRFDALDPHVTRVRAEVFGEEGMRDFSSEKEVLKHMENLLTQDKSPRLQVITARMIPVYRDRDTGSRVIAYLAHGVEVFIKRDEGEWRRVDLLSGVTGYLLSENLNPVPFKTEMNEPGA